ncbi:MAG: hypothetical protein WBQ86_03135 [Candidatus Binatus sp.]
MPARIKRAIALSIAACAIALTGCSSQKTQQQKFIDAMNHGNAAQANQIWLHMNASSREQFAHSQGMQPNVAPDELKKQVTQHYEEEMSGKGNDTGETVERPTPNVHLGGLESLPGYVGPSGQPPQSATVPAQDAPSN